MSYLHGSSTVDDTEGCSQKERPWVLSKDRVRGGSLKRRNNISSQTIGKLKGLDVTYTSTRAL